MENEWRYKELETREANLKKNIEMFVAAAEYFTSLILTGPRTKYHVDECCKKHNEAMNMIKKANEELEGIGKEKLKYAKEYQLYLDAGINPVSLTVEPNPTQIPLLKRKQEENPPPNKKSKKDTTDEEEENEEVIICTNNSESCRYETYRSDCAKCGNQLCESCVESGYESQPGSTEVDEVYCDDCFKKWTFYIVRKDINGIKPCEGFRFTITRDFIIPCEWMRTEGEFLIVINKSKYLILHADSTLSTRLNLMTSKDKKNFIVNGMEWLVDGKQNVLSGLSGVFSLHGWNTSKNKWN